MPQTLPKDHPRSRGVYPGRGRPRVPRGGDHPRSRGVYSRQGLIGMVGSGSSPLARGLRRLDGQHLDPAGIIPARAGFTALLKAGAYTGKDHPRSRGVYTHSGPSRSAVTGSSPLARGLREDRR